MTKLVSIITPMFNAADHIEEAIESVVKQTYSEWELLITDDCSTDDSASRVLEWEKTEPRIRLIRAEVNGGPAKARNRAIEAASGDYLAFLDSDDYWHQDKLAYQVDFMRSGKAVSYTSYQKVSETREPKGAPIHARPNVNYSQLLNSNVIPCLTAMYDVKRLGKQYMKVVGHEDYVYWLDMLKDGVMAYGLDEVLAYYRVRSGSVSGDKVKAAGFQWNIYRNIENLSLPRSLYHFVLYAYKGLKKQRPDVGVRA